jgi:hypothetical protein
MSEMLVNCVAIIELKHPSMPKIVNIINLPTRLLYDLFSFMSLLFLLRDILGCKVSSFYSDPYLPLKARIPELRLFIVSIILLFLIPLISWHSMIKFFQYVNIFLISALLNSTMISKFALIFLKYSFRVYATYPVARTMIRI